MVGEGKTISGYPCNEHICFLLIALYKAFQNVHKNMYYEKLCRFQNVCPKVNWCFITTHVNFLSAQVLQYLRKVWCLGTYFIDPVNILLPVVILTESVNIHKTFLL